MQKTKAVSKRDSEDHSDNTMLVFDCMLMDRIPIQSAFGNIEIEIGGKVFRLQASYNGKLSVSTPEGYLVIEPKVGNVIELDTRKF